MFPGYVTSFIDERGFMHLYFFPGIDEAGNPVYKDISINNTTIKFSEKPYSDTSKEYIFANKNILKIVCNLLDFNGKFYQVELKK